MKQLTKKTASKVLAGIAALLLLSNPLKAQSSDADGQCACVPLEGLRINIDKCQMGYQGVCIGLCEYRDIADPSKIYTSVNINCDKATGVKSVGPEDFSFMDRNNNLNVAIGTPVSSEKEIAVNLDLEGTNGAIMKYEIVNSLGTSIAGKYILAAGASTLKINTKDLAHGIYALKFEVNGLVISKNFVL